MNKNSKLYLFLARWKHRWGYNFNIFKTIYVNFTFLPFKQAIHFPIFVYGKVKIDGHSGKIIIEDRIRQGMIHWGMNTEKFSASKGSALINIAGGKLILKGPVIFSIDCVLNIFGECTIGKYSTIGNSVKICCWNKISIGKSCRITVESQVFDTNFHYMRNLETGRVDRRDGVVIVGDYCWIGNRSTLSKNTQLPDFSVVSGNSLVNKNFVAENVKYPLLAGLPAKIIGSMRVRVFNPLEEEKIERFFRDNPDASYYTGEIGEQDDEKGLEQFFNRL